MKFLILGCNGMAGHMISLYLKEAGHDVTGFARSASPFVPTIVGDEGDTQMLRSAFLEGGYDTAVNCIGMLNKSCDEHRAVYRA